MLHVLSEKEKFAICSKQTVENARSDVMKSAVSTKRKFQYVLIFFLIKLYFIQANLSGNTKWPVNDFPMRFHRSKNLPVQF